MLRRQLLKALFGGSVLTFPRNTVGFQNPADVIANQIVLEGTKDNLRVYQGTAGLGTLIYSISPNIGGTTFDQYGNLVLGGTSYYINAGLHYWIIALDAAGSTANAALGVGIYGPRTHPGDPIGPTNGTFSLNTKGSGNFQAVLGDGNSTFPPITSALLELQHAAVASVLATLLNLDTVARFTFDNNGKLQWGNGTAALDTDLFRSAAGVLQTDGTLDALTANALVGGVEETWHTVSAFGAGWATGPNAGSGPGVAYRKSIDGNIQIVGCMHTTNAAPAANAWNIPVGYRPALTTQRLIVMDTLPASAWAGILTTGSVQINPNPAAAGVDIYFDNFFPPSF